jgi:hypothetical protein
MNLFSIALVIISLPPVGEGVSAHRVTAVEARVGDRFNANQIQAAEAPDVYYGVPPSYEPLSRTKWR